MPRRTKKKPEAGPKMDMCDPAPRERHERRTISKPTKVRGFGPTKASRRQVLPSLGAPRRRTGQAQFEYHDARQLRGLHGSESAPALLRPSSPLCTFAKDPMTGETVVFLSEAQRLGRSTPPDVHGARPRKCRPLPKPAAHVTDWQNQAPHRPPPRHIDGETMDRQARDAMAALPNIAVSLDASANRSAAGVIGVAVARGAVVLSLSRTRLAALPPSVAELAATLVDLDLSHNKLRKLPAAVSALAALRTLDLQANFFASVPAAACALPGLRKLVLKKNKLLVLDVHIGCALSGSLQTLDVSVNAIAELPADLPAALPGLRKLLVGQNRLSDVGAELGALANLKTLSLRGNLIASVSHDVTKNLKRCTSLDASCLFLNAIEPAAFPPLAKLQELVVSNGRMLVLPPTIGALAPTLRVLKLNGQRLRFLPDAVCGLARLETLLLQGNPLEALPRDVGNLAGSLTTLNCAKCEPLPRVPASLVRMAQAGGVPHSGTDDGGGGPATLSLYLPRPLYVYLHNGAVDD